MAFGETTCEADAKVELPVSFGLTGLPSSEVPYQCFLGRAQPSPAQPSLTQANPAQAKAQPGPARPSPKLSLADPFSTGMSRTSLLLASDMAPWRLATLPYIDAEAMRSHRQ